MLNQTLYSDQPSSAPSSPMKTMSSPPPTQPPLRPESNNFPQIFSSPSNSHSFVESDSSLDLNTTKTARFNIRLNENTLQELKNRAQKEGLPYQTLVSSLIHRYLTGQLVDIGPCAQCHPHNNHPD